MSTNEHRINRKVLKGVLLAGFTMLLAGMIALVCHILVITNPYREWTEPEGAKFIGGGRKATHT